MYQTDEASLLAPVHPALFALCLLALVLLAACGGGEAAASVDPHDIGDPENGRLIFENGNDVVTECALCHTLDGVDTEQANGRRRVPSLKGISERAGERVPGMSAVDYIRESILDPDAFVADGYTDSMYSGYQWGLTEEELNDVIAFLLTQ